MAELPDAEGIKDGKETEQTVMRETGLPIARELAEMLLTHMDLTNSLASLTLWSKSYTSNEEATSDKKTIEGSLFRDGITQFVGCFDSKNAVPLVVEAVFPNVDRIAPYFRWLRALRNSYTAHRHGSARQCIVGVLINPVSGEYLGGGHMFAVYAGPSPEGHANLLSLVAMAIRYVETAISSLWQEFDAAARVIPPDDLLKLPLAAVQAQGPADMGKSRGDIRRGMERGLGEVSE